MYIYIYKSYANNTQISDEAVGFFKVANHLWNQTTFMTKDYTVNAGLQAS